jgi:hypothetical protein
LGLSRIADSEEREDDRGSVALSGTENAKEKQEGRSRGNTKRKKRRRGGKPEEQK